MATAVLAEEIVRRDAAWGVRRCDIRETAPNCGLLMHVVLVKSRFNRSFFVGWDAQVSRKQP